MSALRPRIAVSRCLLGEAVRYDGGAKPCAAIDPLRSDFIVVPICPEVEAGMATPRAPIDLVGPAGGPFEVMERASGRVWTTALARVVRAFKASEIDGAVLKAGSPSCGLGSAGRFEDRAADRAADGADGVFAARLRASVPGLPLVDEVALSADPEGFIAAVWARYIGRG